MRSPERRRADNNSARCAAKKTGRAKNKSERDNLALFRSPQRPNEYQGHRPFTPDRSGTSMPILIGAGLIATAILLSTLITAVGTRFVGMESITDDNVWLIDRLTGSVYRCKAPERGKASCDPEIATGGIGNGESRK
jgi:hypothetical protein